MGQKNSRDVQELSKPNFPPESRVKYFIPIFATPDHFDGFVNGNATITYIDSCDSEYSIKTPNQTIFGDHIITPLFENISKGMDNTTLLMAARNFSINWDSIKSNVNHAELMMTAPRVYLSDPLIHPSQCNPTEQLQPIHHRNGNTIPESQNEDSFVTMMSLSTIHYPGCCMIPANSATGTAKPTPVAVPFLRMNLPTQDMPINKYFLDPKENRLSPPAQFTEKLLPLHGFGNYYPPLGCKFNYKGGYMGPGWAEDNKGQLKSLHDIFSEFNYPPPILTRITPTVGYSFSANNFMTQGIGDWIKMDHLATILILDVTSPFSIIILNNFLHQTAHMINAGSYYPLSNVPIHVILLKSELIDQMVISREKIEERLQMVNFSSIIFHHAAKITYDQPYRNLFQSDPFHRPLLPKEDFKPISNMLWGLIFKDYCQKNANGFFKENFYFPTSTPDYTKSQYSLLPIDPSFPRHLMHDRHSYIGWPADQWQAIYGYKRADDIGIAKVSARQYLPRGYVNLGVWRQVRAIQYITVALRYAVVNNLHPIVRTDYDDNNVDDDKLKEFQQIVINPFNSATPPKLTSLYHLFNKYEENLYGKANGIDWNDIYSYLPSSFSPDRLNSTKPIFFENQQPSTIGFISDSAPLIDYKYAEIYQTFGDNKENDIYAAHPQPVLAPANTIPSNLNFNSFVTFVDTPLLSTSINSTPWYSDLARFDPMKRRLKHLPKQHDSLHDWDKMKRMMDSKNFNIFEENQPTFGLTQFNNSIRPVAEITNNKPIPKQSGNGALSHWFLPEVKGELSSYVDVDEVVKVFKESMLADPINDPIEIVVEDPNDLNRNHTPPPVTRATITPPTLFTRLHPESPTTSLSLLRTVVNRMYHDGKDENHGTNQKNISINYLHRPFSLPYQVNLQHPTQTVQLPLSSSYSATFAPLEWLNGVVVIPFVYKHNSFNGQSRKEVTSELMECPHNQLPSFLKANPPRIPAITSPQNPIALQNDYKDIDKTKQSWQRVFITEIVGAKGSTALPQLTTQSNPYLAGSDTIYQVHAVNDKLILKGAPDWRQSVKEMIYNHHSPHFWLDGGLPSFDCPITFVVVCLNEWTEGHSHRDNKDDFMEVVIREDVPLIPNTITRQEFDFFAENAPEIWKYELIYQTFLFKKFASPQKLEILWDVKFVHKDDLVDVMRDVETDAIQKRLELYRAMMGTYKKE